jgi:hypothetical protein
MGSLAFTATVLPVKPFRGGCSDAARYHNHNSVAGNPPDLPCIHNSMADVPLSSKSNRRADILKAPSFAPKGDVSFSFLLLKLRRHRGQSRCIAALGPRDKI